MNLFLTDVSKSYSVTVWLAGNPESETSVARMTWP